MLLAFAGCADNSLVLKGRVDQYSQQQAALLRQNQQYQSRAVGADRSNEDLTTELGLARQQAQVAEADARATREQLHDLTAQLSRLQADKQESDQKANAAQASLHRQTGITINPNNSYLQTLPVIHQPDVYVRRDGDVIRIELPGNRLFDPGGTEVRPGAQSLIAEVAAEVRRDYPDQIIGIEGHTDSDPVMGGQWRNNHQLSVAWAMAVYNVMTGSLRFRADQLFVVGHGGNHPVVSNAYPQGKQRNRRVELVVYPERRE